MPKPVSITVAARGYTEISQNLRWMPRPSEYLLLEEGYLDFVRNKPSTLLHVILPSHVSLFSSGKGQSDVHRGLRKFKQS
jgi:hypothetical protein